jgi:hypothetical protein
MPGAHVDKIYQAAQDKLFYKPLTDLEVLNATPKQIAEDERLKAKNDSIGGEVFRDIENSNLTPQEKQEVHKKLAQYGMQQELSSPGVDTNPNTLLRANNRYTNYTSAYLNHHAKGYVESVRDLSFEGSTQTPLPPSVVGKVDTAFKVVENAYASTNTSLLRDNLSTMLKSNGVSEQVLTEFRKVFDAKGDVVTLRGVDQDLKNDVDKFLRQNGVKSDLIQGADQAFKDHHSKMSKLANLAGGQIPPEDMPANGQLVGYLEKHGLTVGMSQEQKQELRGVRVQDFQTLHKMHVDVAHRMVDATAKNLSQLSPEAQEFLKSAFQPITDDGAMNVAVASTLVLRLASPKVSTEANHMGVDPSTTDHGIILERGAKTVQRYVNQLGAGSDKQDYATLGSEDLLKDETLKQQTLDSFKAVAKGEDLNAFSKKAGGPLTVDPGAQSQVNNFKKMVNLGAAKDQSIKKKLDAEYQQIAAAQKKLDKLNKPGVNFEKFKAFFSKGGISAAKDDTQKTLTRLEKDFGEKVEQKEKETLQQKETQLLKQAVSRKKKLETELPSLSQGEAQNLLDTLDSLSPERTNKVPSSLQLSKNDARDLLDTLDKLSPERTNKVPSSLQISSEEAGDLLKGLEKLKGAVKQKRDSISVSDDGTGSLKLNGDQASDLVSKLNKIKGSSDELDFGSLKLSGDQAGELLNKLNGIKGEPQELELGSLRLSEDQAGDLLKALKEQSEDVGVEVDDLGVEGFDLSDTDFSNLLEKLRDVSPETWEQVDNLVETELSVDEIGDLIQELEDLDLEGPSQTLDGVDASPEHIEKMIKELEELDLGEGQQQTRGRSQSVSAVLQGGKHDQGSPKSKVGSNSLRSTHPELVREEGQTPRGPGVKLNNK